MNRLKQVRAIDHLADQPPPVPAGQKSSVSQADTVGKVRHAHLPSFMSDDNISPGVVALLSRCRPAHISRLVAPVIVNALNRVFRAWPRPHVGQEFPEAFSPFIAHADAAATVSVKERVRGIATPILHRRPSPILRRSAAMSVLEFCLGRASLLQAPTALRGPPAKVRAEYDGLVPARASA